MFYLKIQAHKMKLQYFRMSPNHLISMYIILSGEWKVEGFSFGL